jgi:hypothetical protein
MRKLLYFCIVFFMVLDLRLMEIGLPGGNPSFFVVGSKRTAIRKKSIKICKYQ